MPKLARRLAPPLAAAALALAAAAPAGAAFPHTVLAGETLWSIAAANGMDTATVAAFNGISPETGVETGSTVLIPAPGEAGAAPVAAVPQAQPSEAVSAPQEGAQPAVSASSPLVQAVGWQESGFNNSMVSPTGARGVMQIMPDTWEFIQDNLAGGSLDPNSAADNVRAGTLYLDYLIRLKGSREAGIAAYYQGPNRSTILPETETYVNNVLGLEQRFGR